MENKYDELVNILNNRHHDEIVSYQKLINMDITNFPIYTTFLAARNST